MRPEIAFAGTPEFAVPTLRALLRAGADVPLVLTQPDRPSGRGRRLAPPPVKLAAASLGLRLEQPESLPQTDAGERWGPRPDLIVVIAYGLLLPAWMLAWPRRGCVNVHASLLPRWRGAAPIQRALLAGDPETGVSLMRMERGLDTGPVFASRATRIGARETAGELHGRLARIGADLLVATLPAILDGSCRPAAQDERLVTYAAKIDKAEARLDWRSSASDLERRVRAFNPWPVALAWLGDGRRLRVLKAEVRPLGVEALPGRIVGLGRDGIDVATGAGCLRLLEVQPPSGRVMDASAYLAAHSLEHAVFV